MQKSRLLLRERFSPLTYLFLTVALFLTMSLYITGLCTCQHYFCIFIHIFLI